MKKLIGLAEVKALTEGNDIDLPKGHHAYAKAIVVAVHQRSFEVILEARLKLMGLDLLNCEDVRPLTRSEEVKLHDKLRLLDDTNRVAFLTFHLFDPENE